MGGEQTKETDKVDGQKQRENKGNNRRTDGEEVDRSSVTNQPANVAHRARKQVSASKTFEILRKKCLVR